MKTRDAETPFKNIDRYPACANPNKKTYESSALTTHSTFLFQLIMLGRAHTWMHFDDQNAVNDIINIGEEFDLALLKTTKKRIKYFQTQYR
jgi:hypothetical protein